MRQVREILRLKYEQRLPHRAIARTCGVGLGTVSEYGRRAQQAALSWPLPAEWDDAQLEARLFQRVGDLVGVPRPLPDMAWVHRELKRPGVTLQRLHLEYLQQQPEGYRYSQFCRHYHDWARTLAPTMRQVHRAGEKAFVDFSGKRPAIIEAATGEVVPVELFVGVLGASCYVYAEACPAQDLASWITAHVRMVEFFGGAPAMFVPDNLRSGVTHPCRYEPVINRTYLEFAVASAPAAFRVRVWQITSWGRGPRGGSRCRRGLVLTILPVRAAVPVHGRPDLWATLMSPRDLRVYNISNPVGATKGSGPGAGSQQPAERAVAGERVTACAGDEHGRAVEAINQECPQRLSCLCTLTTEHTPQLLVLSW
jgi:transposase